MTDYRHFKLRPYQQEALDSIPESGAYLICMATGLGKSVVFSQVPRKGRMLILSHRDELVHQPEKYFDCSFGIEQASEISHGEEIISASVQSLVRRLEKFKPDNFDVVVVDEAHHSSAPTYRKIIDYFNPRLLLGFTATPNRNDGVGLKEIYQDIIFERDLRWGIENGYLSDIHCLRINIGYDLRRVAIRLGDYAPEALDRAVNIEVANKAVAQAYKLYAKPPCLIFCASVAHAENLANLIDGAVAVRGGEDRSDIVKAFSNGEIPCLTNCMIFTEGTDIPSINTVIMARPTKNISLYLQCIGRGTRLYPGKEYMTLIDCVGASDEIDLCTAPSLLGLDIKDIPAKLREKIQGNLFDLPDIIESCMDTPEAWIKNVHRVELWAKRNDYDTHDINFFKMPDGSMIVQNIKLPPEDSLGRIEWNGRPEPTQKVFDEVYRLLCNDYSEQRKLWDLSLTKGWGSYPASDKQKNLIQKKLKDFNVNNLTKFEAGQIITRLFAPQPPTDKQIYFLQRRGYDITGMTRQEASKIIGRLKSI